MYMYYLCTVDKWCIYSVYSDDPEFWANMTILDAADDPPQPQPPTAATATATANNRPPNPSRLGPSSSHTHRSASPVTPQGQQSHPSHQERLTSGVQGGVQGGNVQPGSRGVSHQQVRPNQPQGAKPHPNPPAFKGGAGTMPNQPTGPARGQQPNTGHGVFRQGGPAKGVPLQQPLHAHPGGSSSDPARGSRGKENLSSGRVITRSGGSKSFGGGFTHKYKFCTMISMLRK